MPLRVKDYIYMNIYIDGRRKDGRKERWGEGWRDEWKHGWMDGYTPAKYHRTVT